MGIGLFPPTRRVLIEKLIKKKTSDKGLCRLEFTDFKYTETFIVDSVSPIGFETIADWGVDSQPSIMEYQGIRTEWKPVEFRIIECESTGNGKRLSNWINSHLFAEYHSNVRASSIKFIELYDDGSDQKKDWTLHGCIPISVIDKNTSITLKLSINHASVSFF